jgi:hypothetical protein
MTDISNKLALRKSLTEYLLELKQITGENVKTDSLSSVESLERIREASLAVFQNMNKSKFIVRFDEKDSKKFKDFIANLSKANSSSVYIWTNRANLHGLCKIASINSIDFSFPFNINPDGVIVFLTEDLKDKLLLDFYRDSKEQEILEIELQGENWASVSL